MGLSVTSKIGKGANKRLKRYNLLSITCQKVGILNAEITVQWSAKFKK